MIQFTVVLGIMTISEAALQQICV